jgi:glycosyltransferase involved in cell wall biosynthesis
METNALGQRCAAQIIGTFRVEGGGGGAQRLAHNLAMALTAEGFSSVAIALRSEGLFMESLASDVSVITLDTRASNPLSLVKAFMRLRSAIRQKKIDVVHVHGSHSLPFVVLAAGVISRKAKVVFTWHDSGAVLGEKGWRLNLTVWALRRCDSVSGSSSVVAQKLAERAGLDNVGVFHGGVPIRPKPNFDATSQPLILWIGRIVPPKDPQILVRALARLRAEGLHFTACIVGQPHASTVWYMEETRALIRSLGLEDIVSMPGFVSDGDLYELMGRAEIGVQTSQSEGMSIALMEQMMSGLAVVATDVGDTKDAIEDGVSGLLISPNQEYLLVGALRRLLTSSSLRKQFSAAAYQRAVDRFSFKAMACRAAREYASVLINR